jgi:hypothetical protein
VVLRFLELANMLLLDPYEMFLKPLVPTRKEVLVSLVHINRVVLRSPVLISMIIPRVLVPALWSSGAW